VRKDLLRAQEHQLLFDLGLWNLQKGPDGGDKIYGQLIIGHHGTI